MLRNIYEKRIEEERHKILDGVYSSRVVDGRQRKHIKGTREYEQNRAKMRRYSPESEPSKLDPDVDVQALVDEYKGTGKIRFENHSLYPIEDVVSNSIIGQTWVKSIKRYVDTRMFTISYSSTGVHIIPINERGRI